MLRILPIDIVDISKMQKCGLKYVIYILQNKKAEPFLTLPQSLDR